MTLRKLHVTFSILFFSLFFLPKLQAQDLNGNKGIGLLFNISYAYQVPGGDLVDRFGNNFNLGLNLEYLSKNSNIIFGFESGFIFGSEVKTNVLSNLVTAEGLIIGNDRAFADIQLRERGFYIGAMVGKLFSLSEVNKRSGIRLTVSSGLLQHKIRIQDDPLRDVAQLSTEYKKGYDRLSNGLAFNEFFGYQYLSRNKRINFYAGVEFTQAFTQSRRDFNFDTMSVDEASRVDLLFGVRVGWVLPFYLGNASEIYY